MRFIRFILLIICVSALSADIVAQDQPAKRKGSRIIDDTTKQVYGPKTSRYFYEKDVFFNRQTYHAIDTAIRNFHRYTYVQRHQYQYQDLGNIGTAIRPIYYQTPTNIGATSGFQSYDMYWDSEQIKNYDTKSPYTWMNVILGGKGRSMTRAAFSRNINPRWNFGFDYRGLLIDKQVQRRAKGDRNVRSTYYDIYTSFQSKDSTYRLFADFKRNKIEADEYGGIRKITDPFKYADYFFTNAQVMLTEASSSDIRMQFHVFHQYEIGKGLQLYHTFDRYRQGVRFVDTPASAPQDYYDYVEVDSATTQDRTKFKYVRNEVGIKGNLLKLFYNGYFAIRDYSSTNRYMTDLGFRVAQSGVENYLGGRMSLNLDSIGEVSGWAELQNNGNYRIEGKIKSRWFEASLKQLQYDVPLLYQQYRGSHDIWFNKFDPTNVTQLNGFLHYSSSALNVSPGLTFTRVGNYAYFAEGELLPTTQTVLPLQTGEEQVIFSPEFRFSVTAAKHITLSSQIIYTKLLKGNAMQIPEMFLNAQLSYENIFFNGNLDMHTGVDFHYQSTYNAMAYDVATQQFYVHQLSDAQTPRVFPQNTAFPLVDLFFSARIKKGRIFVKYNNLIQIITKEGYLPTPEYPGQRNILDFGFDWSFYD